MFHIFTFDKGLHTTKSENGNSKKTTFHFGVPKIN